MHWGNGERYKCTNSLIHVELRAYIDIKCAYNYSRDPNHRTTDIHQNHVIQTVLSQALSFDVHVHIG